MLTTVAKKVQSRLSRKGVKVVLGDVKTQCELMITDIENPTEVELLAVQEYFMSNATTLTVITNDVDTLDSLETAGDVEAIAPVTNEDDQDYPELPAPLATTNKSELVASTAGELGIVLNTGEIELIAQNVNYSSDDLQESLEEIKSAIIAFVRHKVALNSQKIGETLEEITQVATDGFNQNSQQLTDGLQNINKQLQQQRTDFKSKVKATLSVLQLPAVS